MQKNNLYGTPKLLDAGLITATQKVEHFEISGYGATHTRRAERMAKDNATRLFQQTRDEESAANDKITQIAESHANLKAQS